MIKKDFAIRLLKDKTHKINVETSEDYRAITKMLSASKMTWYSYEDKQSRPIRVIAKNVHHSCDPNMIVNDLKTQGLKAVSAVNKL